MAMLVITRGYLVDFPLKNYSGNSQRAMFESFELWGIFEKLSDTWDAKALRLGARTAAIFLPQVSGPHHCFCLFVSPLFFQPFDGSYYINPSM